MTSLAAKLCDPSHLHVFTMRYENSYSEDTFYAERLCQLHGFSRDDIVKHLSDVIRACETHDPNTIRAAVPMYLLAKHIAEETDVKVVLSGEGADEIFAGYNYFRLALDGDSVNEECARLVRNIHTFDLLRADRCFAAFGLEVRVPYLDRDVIARVATFKGRLKMFMNREEKTLLRRAFADFEDLQKTGILRRAKERFSDGIHVPEDL